MRIIRITLISDDGVELEREMKVPINMDLPKMIIRWKEVVAHGDVVDYFQFIFRHGAEYIDCDGKFKAYISKSLCRSNIDHHRR